MKRYLLPETGNFYKGNMHCHSNFSDGYHSPEELKKLYKAHGYSVLSITDHEGLFYHPELNDEDFLTIAGYEIEINQVKGENYDNWIVAHLCLYKKSVDKIFQPGFDRNYNHNKFRWLHDENLRARVRSKGEPIPKIYSADNINKAIKRAQGDGFLVTYNHPKWSQEDYSRYTRYTGMNCLEIYNHGCFVAGHDEHNGEVYDALLRKGERLFCVAADDNHRSSDEEKHDMFGGFTMFKAESLTYENIINAFEKGNFYSSTGPLIKEIYVEDGIFTVKCETPAARVRFLTGNRHVGLVYNTDKTPVYAAEFELHPDDRYVRAEVIDKEGNVAYTQAYFLDKM